jgi:hypothetical protein
MCSTETQLNSAGVSHVLNLKLNSTDLRVPPPVLDSREPVDSNMQMTDICRQ